MASAGLPWVQEVAIGPEIAQFAPRRLENVPARRMRWAPPGRDKTRQSPTHRGQKGSPAQPLCKGAQNGQHATAPQMGPPSRRRRCPRAPRSCRGHAGIGRGGFRHHARPALGLATCIGSVWRIDPPKNVAAALASAPPAALGRLPGRHGQMFTRPVGPDAFSRTPRAASALPG